MTMYDRILHPSAYRLDPRITTRISTWLKSAKFTLRLEQLQNSCPSWYGSRCECSRYHGNKYRLIVSRSSNVFSFIFWDCGRLDKERNDLDVDVEPPAEFGLSALYNFARVPRSYREFLVLIGSSDSETNKNRYRSVYKMCNDIYNYFSSSELESLTNYYRS